MAECLWCKRSGFFLSLSKDHLCKGCVPVVLLEVSQRSRVINESAQLIENSKNLDTRLSRCDVILSNARCLLKYEEHGIGGMQPRPSDLISNCLARKDRILNEVLQGELQNLISVTSAETSSKGTLTKLTKLLLRVQGYKGNASDPEALAPIEKQVRETMHATQLAIMLDGARKAEFKQQKKKALDGYYEALYFLRHDDIDDALQTDQIATISEKIRSLGGEVEPRQDTQDAHLPPD